MVLVQKWPFLKLFFLRMIDRENVFYDILERKNAFLGYKKKKVKKVEKLTFFKVVNPWYGSKNGHFSNFFFLRIIEQENVFYDILERENAFLGYKNKKFKCRKIDIFPKGLTHAFGPKWPFFKLFLFTHY